MYKYIAHKSNTDHGWSSARRLTMKSSAFENESAVTEGSPRYLHSLQVRSKAALREFIVARQRYQRALKAGKPEGHYEQMEQAEWAFKAASALAPPSRHLELIARQEAARILRSDAGCLVGGKL
jgi:hypothetical protein